MSREIGVFSVMSLIFMVFFVKELLIPIVVFSGKYERVLELYQALKTSLDLAQFVRNPIGIITVREHDGKIRSCGTAYEQALTLRNELRDAIKYYEEHAIYIPSSNLIVDYNNLLELLTWSNKVAFKLKASV